MERIIRQADLLDLDNLTSFLKKSNVEVDGMKGLIDYYLLVEDSVTGNVRGTIGIQPFHKIGLLRSLVLLDATGEEILFLLQQTIKLAKEKGFDTLYCMLNKDNAIQLFRLLGFKNVDKEELPNELMESNVVKRILSVNNPNFLYYSLKNVNKSE